MEILNYSFDGEGMRRVYENEKWTVGLKNWKPMNDLSGIDRLERHLQTDELFVLLNGRCTLVFANETEAGLAFAYEEMEPMRVYNIPAALWHNTITQHDTKLCLIEDSATCADNSEERMLTPAQIDEIKAHVR